MSSSQVSLMLGFGAFFFVGVGLWQLLRSRASIERTFARRQAKDGEHRGDADPGMPPSVVTWNRVGGVLLLLLGAACAALAVHDAVRGAGAG